MIVNISAIVAAVATLVTAIVALVVSSRLVRFLQSADVLVRNSDEVMSRLRGVVEEAEGVARDARRVEARVSGMVEPLLDEIEPPLRAARSLIVGLRAGLGAWARGNGARPPIDARPRHSDPSTREAQP